MDVPCSSETLLTKQATDWVWSMGHNLLIPEWKEKGILIFKDKNLSTAIVWVEILEVQEDMQM